jgi:AcrR family transcriptional regulator
MEEVTREDLIEWFGSDRGISDMTLRDLNDELNDTRQMIFEHYGFRG